MISVVSVFRCSNCSTKFTAWLKISIIRWYIKIYRLFRLKRTLSVHFYFNFIVFFRKSLAVPTLDNEASIVNRASEKFASYTVQKKTEELVQCSTSSIEPGNYLLLYVVLCNFNLNFVNTVQEKTEDPVESSTSSLEHGNYLLLYMVLLNFNVDFYLKDRQAFTFLILCPKELPHKKQKMSNILKKQKFQRNLKNQNSKKLVQNS